MFRITITEKATGHQRTSLCSFGDEKAASDHVKLLKELTESPDIKLSKRHAHLKLYDYTVINMSKRKGRN
jgi:hypothetical protein